MRETEEQLFLCRREPPFPSRWNARRPASAPGTSFSRAPRPTIRPATARSPTSSRRLPALRDMGFDVLYLPPIHPIGTTNRKGKNNSL